MKFPLVLCLLCPLVQVAFHSVQGWKAFKNDATEIIPELSEQPEPLPDLSNSNNKTMNRAENGGRYPHHPLEPKDASDYSCRELHFTRYITDGPCRSAKPVTELVCSGQCGPAHLQPNAIGRKWLWRQSAPDYRCIPDRYRTQRIQLLCPGGEEARTLKIRVVASCKCKRYTRFHNQSELKDFGKEAARPPKNKKPRLSRIRSGKSKQPELENAY